MRKHFDPIINLGIFLGFILLVYLIVLLPVVLASDSDDQCDYMPPPEFAWEGELNPNEFDNWETLSVQPSIDASIVFGFIKNPDQTSPIEIVVMKMAIYDGSMLGYCYFKDGQPYSYVWDSENNKYVEYKFTQEEKKRCMQCHQDKLVPREAI